MRLAIWGFLLGWWPQYLAITILIQLCICLFRFARWAYWEANDRWYFYRYLGHF